MLCLKVLAVRLEIYLEYFYYNGDITSKDTRSSTEERYRTYSRRCSYGLDNPRVKILCWLWVSF